MEQDEDQRQFFRDVGATAEQTVEEVRGFEENFSALWQATSTLPWTAGLARKWQGYVEQDFGAAFAFARALRQAKDFQDFTRIQTEYVQNCVALLCAQAEDFAQTYTRDFAKDFARPYTELASSTIRPPQLYPLG